MNKTLGVWLCFLLAGCSATGRTSRDATEIAGLARSSETRFTDIGNEAKSPEPNLDSISKGAAAGAKEQSKIVDLTKDIHRQIPKMEDKVPWWATLLGQLALVGGLITAAIILIFTPLGRAIGSSIAGALSFLSSFLPTRATKMGELMARADSDKDNLSQKEAQAIIFEQNPSARKAYKRAKKKLDKEPKQ